TLLGAVLACLSALWLCPASLLAQPDVMHAPPPEPEWQDPESEVEPADPRARTPADEAPAAREAEGKRPQPERAAAASPSEASPAPETTKAAALPPAISPRSTSAASTSDAPASPKRADSGPRTFIENGKPSRASGAAAAGANPDNTKRSRASGAGTADPAASRTVIENSAPRAIGAAAASGTPRSGVENGKAPAAVSGGQGAAGRNAPSSGKPAAAAAPRATHAAAPDPADPTDDTPDPADVDAPPPPDSAGDFAGHGAATPQPTAAQSTDGGSQPSATDPASAAATAPQDDFESNVQEYRRGEKREYSVRFDPLNWLLLGRLGLELEVSLFKYLTVQLTPIFVTARSPIAVNYAGLDDPLTQHSNGIGPISGVSLGVGAWFWGEPFKGYVLRLELSNYGYTYRAADGGGKIDEVDFTERRLTLFVGSHSRFGPFTFAGGFGLGYELHQVERCGLSVSSNGNVSSRSDDCKGKQLIALDRTGRETADLNGPLHPVYFQARFTLGVVF
ncbi:MAG: hypothetical protein ABW321_08265, partial [Polyangiales bacterium]